MWQHMYNVIDINLIIINVVSLQLILANVLNALYDAINHMLRKNVEKRTLLESLDGVFLALDEICDGGWVGITQALLK